MSERYWNVSTSIVIAWICWIAGVTLVVLPCVGVLDHPFAALGCVVTMFGCMTMLRSWVHRCALSTADVFALGQASVRVVRDR